MRHVQHMEVKPMKWVTRSDGHRYAKHAGIVYRCRWTPSGYIISQKNGDDWAFVAGDVHREDAERKAMEWVNSK